MAAKRPNPVTRAAAVLFTSLVAPLIVNVTAGVIKIDARRPSAEPVHEVVCNVAPPAPSVRLLPPATVTPRADDRAVSRTAAPVSWRPIGP
jgi:hypothetical protein